MNTSKNGKRETKRPTAVDLCCGVGGFSLGFEQAGFDIIAAADIEQIHIDAYQKNFPNCKACCADLSTVSGHQLRELTGIGNKMIDVAISGPPCQGFSLIGKRLQEDPRSLLLLEVARLLPELSPSYFVIENVSGILLGSAKRMLEEFVKRVEHNGYVVVKPIRTLDAAEFGVPQRRRRVFLLGHRKELPPPQYPDPEYLFDADGDIDCPTVWDAIGDLPRVDDIDSLLSSDGYHGALGEPSNYAKILRGEANDTNEYSAERSRNGNGLTGCLRTQHTPKTLGRFARTKQGEVEKVSRYPRLAKDGLAPTLRAGTGPDRGSYMAARPIHPTQDRCITVREAARLHSLPDWFHFNPTKWHGFRQIGNSVPPWLARAVAQCVREAIANSNGR